MLQSETVKKYDKYKDSGIEWIGEIPQNWDVKRLKVLAKLQTGNTPPKENDVSAYYTDEGFLWVKPDNLSGFSPIKNTNEYLNEEGYKIARVVPKGTPLVCCIGSIGKYGVAEQDVAFNQQINAVIFNKMMDNKFGLYHISCQEEQHWYYANGNVVQILNTQNQGKLLFACPPINEQKQIADYLDKKCGEIDRVVETEKAVIEKLKEYKQSIITEAVTKGLDKSASLKDSGIEWIGKIPQHWNITQISKLYKVILGKMLCTNPSTDTDTLENYLCSANIKFDGVKTDEIKQMYFNKNEKEMYLLKENDIVISEGGDAGTASIYKGEVQPCYIQNAVHKVCTFDINKMLNKFLYYWIFLCKKCGYIDLICNKATIMHYTKEKVSKTPIVFLPIEEQQQIIDYLNNKCSEIDKVIANKEQVIEKLTEYKKSLIYECVTGKRKVVE